MTVRPKHILFLGALIAGICIHISTAFAASPEDTVVDFSKAYFMLDPDMENYLPEEGKVNDEGKAIMAVYFETIEDQARNQGYEFSYFKMRLSKIKTEVLSSDDEMAKIRITGIKKRSINPLYRIVGDIFSIQDAHQLDQIITVVNENGAWKIAPDTFELLQ
ncbi:MAG: hypothetical protein JEZ12_24505 [Desulfobacterium sp.]|nr:hypothetical protein [Desulfobacterium sp.]